MKREGEQNFEPSQEPIQHPEHEKSLGEINLIGLVVSLDNYNEQFEPGAMIAEAIMGPKEGETRSIEKRREDEVQNILKRHREDLGRAGLSLEPVKSGITLIPSGVESMEDVKHHTEMRINLADGKKFVNYLDALKEAPLGEGQAKALEAIAQNLTIQLSTQYQLENPDDERMIQLFGSLDQIIERYHELDKNGEAGISESVAKLSKYLEIARGKYLKEYLWAQNSGLLNEVGEKDKYFGPSKWHTDANEEQYRDRYWGRAVKTVKAMGKNPNARIFQLEVIDRLEESLRYAKSDLMQDPTYADQADVFKAIIDDAYDELEKIKSEE